MDMLVRERRFNAVIPAGQCVLAAATLRIVIQGGIDEMLTWVRDIAAKVRDQIEGGRRDATALATSFEAEGRYVSSDGSSARIRVLAFDRNPRVSGNASFLVSLTNDGNAAWQQTRLVLRWEIKCADELIHHDQVVGEVRLQRGAIQTIEGVVPVPTNHVLDAVVEFHLLSLNDTTWWSTDRTASVSRHISGQIAADAPGDFDYEAFWRGFDLTKDWWTPVGPATRAEYESLGRGKCASLVQLGLHPDSRVLDIGCGTGQLTEALALTLSSGGLYYGTDVSDVPIEFCRAKFQETHFRFLRNEHTALPIHGLEFDVIYLGSVFTHMFPADISVMLGEIRRLLANSGFVVADAFVSPTIPDYIGNRSMIQLNEGNLLSAFRDHGFCSRELYSINWNEQCRRVIYHLAAQES
jgi:SAM-dependent methyltransferase